MSIENECNPSPWTKGQFEVEILNQNSIFTAAFLGNELAGFSIMRVTAPEAELLEICVSAKFRRLGIAKSLICKSISESKHPIESIFLEVRSKNSDAISLYRKLNFKEVSTRIGYYRDPKDDAKVMKLDLLTETLSSTPD